MQDRGEKPSLGRVREAVRVAIGDIERLFAVRCLLFAVCYLHNHAVQKEAACPLHLGCGFVQRRMRYHPCREDPHYTCTG